MPQEEIGVAVIPHVESRVFGPFYDDKGGYSFKILK
jgi:hypothetical protein